MKVCATSGARCRRPRLFEPARSDQLYCCRRCGQQPVDGPGESGRIRASTTAADVDVPSSPRAPQPRCRLAAGRSTARAGGIPRRVSGWGFARAGEHAGDCASGRTFAAEERIPRPPPSPTPCRSPTQSGETMRVCSYRIVTIRSPTMRTPDGCTAGPLPGWAGWPRHDRGARAAAARWPARRRHGSAAEVVRCTARPRPSSSRRHTATATAAMCGDRVAF